MFKIENIQVLQLSIAFFAVKFHVMLIFPMQWNVVQRHAATLTTLLPPLSDTKVLSQCTTMDIRQQVL